MGKKGVLGQPLPLRLGPHQPNSFSTSFLNPSSLTCVFLHLRNAQPSPPTITPVVSYIQYINTPFIILVQTGLVGFGRHYHPLDLLGAPTSIGLAHVRRGLNRRNELKGNVADTNQTDNRASDDVENLVVEQDAADKNVD